MTDAPAKRSKCGAKKRSGGKCQQPAGWGTDHVGQGKCKLHGGATPIKSGRYSVIEREDLAELTDHFANDENPLDIGPELEMVRALLTKFIDRYDELVDALFEWNAEEYAEAEAEDRKARPQRLPELSDAISYLKTATKIAHDEKRLQVQNAISRKDLMRVLSEMGRSVDQRVDDSETREAIKDDWASIRL